MVLVIKKKAIEEKAEECKGNGCSYFAYCIKSIEDKEINNACMNPVYLFDKLKGECELMDRKKRAARLGAEEAEDKGSSVPEPGRNTRRGKMALVIKGKRAVKVAKRAAANKDKAPRKSVAELMRQTLGKDIGYPFKKLQAMVKKQFPKSKWDETHYAWYKSQITNKKMKGL